MTDDERLLQIATAAWEYAMFCGRLAGIVQWCVNHEGETLFDNPLQLEFARDVLAELRRFHDRQRASP